MYSIIITMDNAKFKEVKNLTQINVLNPSDGSSQPIREDSYTTLIPYEGKCYSFISDNEIFITSGENIKSLHFYR